MNTKKTLLACLAIVLVGATITVIVFSTEPSATREGASKQTPMLVDVTEVQKDTYRPTIVAMGTVRPSKDIVLSPRVSGEIVERAPAFMPGGFVREGDLLLRIDPADYRNALEQARSDLQQALADLSLEEGRQTVARKDYELFDGTLPTENESLVLREPQLGAARSRVKAARAAVAQRELELERTSVRAPFNAHILSRNVNVGSQVSPQDQLGRLVGMDTYWVVTTVPLSKLRWLSFAGDEAEAETKISDLGSNGAPRDPAGVSETGASSSSARARSGDGATRGGERDGSSAPVRSDREIQPVSTGLPTSAENGRIGSTVEIRDPGAWAEGAHRVGYLDTLIGALEEQTRMARVLVTVPDPLAHRTDSSAGTPPLMIGTFVEARIQGQPIADVIRLDRDHVRKNDTVWIMEDGELRIRDVEIVLQDEGHAYIRSGLEDGDQVVITNLSTVAEGSRLRLDGEGEGSDEHSASGTGSPASDGSPADGSSGDDSPAGGSPGGGR